MTSQTITRPNPWSACPFSYLENARTDDPLAKRFYPSAVPGPDLWLKSPPSTDQDVRDCILAQFRKPVNRIRLWEAFRRERLGGLDTLQAWVVSLSCLIKVLEDERAV